MPTLAGCHAHARVGMPDMPDHKPTQTWARHPNVADRHMVFRRRFLATPRHAIPAEYRSRATPRKRSPASARKRLGMPSTSADNMLELAVVA